ncbi:acyltransferase [Streptomyces sp. NPDC090108]|uniref:acyltransferase family protein n=1 Tax=Streptomyces sp. NPDC090108 TaxID=3365947 RepID=UPI00380318F3
MSRDRYVDFLRAWAIVSVVLGHWLITALVRGPDGVITAPELLASLPWTQWLTLGFQIMPLFFLAGGHAAGGSWERTRAAGGTAGDWVGRRAARLLLPVAAYGGLVLLAVGVCAAAGVDRDVLALAGWAMGMQFWFLPVYLVLGALTPLLHAAHRRWGPRVPVAMGAAALVVDVLVTGFHTPYVGPIDYVLVWGVAYQLGFCWRDGLLTRRRLTPAGMAAGGATAFAALIVFGPFPVSLILVTGQDPGNTDPPSAAMLAWVVTQAGLSLLLAPLLRPLLDRERVWRAVRTVGGASMTLYLWHMLPVLIAAGAFYLTGLAPEPTLGSAAWWALRVPWLLVLGLLLAGALPVLRPLERGPALPAERARPRMGLGRTGSLGRTSPLGRTGSLGRTSPLRRAWSPSCPWPLWCGLAASIAALTRFATQGFAPGGAFPALPALGLALGTALVTAARWSGVRREGEERGERGAYGEHVRSAPEGAREPLMGEPRT